MGTWLQLGFKGERFNKELGADLTQKSVGDNLVRRVKIERPYRCWVSVPCTAYTIMQNLRKKTKLGNRRLAAKRLETRQIVRQCIKVAKQVVRTGGHLYWEWPRRCRGWSLKLLKGLREWMSQKASAYLVKLDGCQFGLRNPRTNNLLQKAWSILTTDEQLLQLQQVCSKKHRQQFVHETIQGADLTASTAYYPQAMVDRVLYLWSENGQPS